MPPDQFEHIAGFEWKAPVWTQPEAFLSVWWKSYNVAMTRGKEK